MENVIRLDKFDESKVEYAPLTSYFIKDSFGSLKILFDLIRSFGHINPNTIIFKDRVVYFSINSDGYRLVLVD